MLSKGSLMQSVQGICDALCMIFPDYVNPQKEKLY